MQRVLSIDGGGIRGVLPATWLMSLEELTGRRTADLFDLVVGTSTGGILALGLTCPQEDGRSASAAQLRRMYTDHGREIFPGFPSGQPALSAHGHPEPKYPSAPLERYLQAVFGLTRLSEALRPAAVVTCDLPTAEPLLFTGGGLDQSGLGDAPMTTAALATSSFPSYFAPVPFRDPAGRERSLVDGGVVARDPAFVGLSYAVAGVRRSGAATAVDAAGVAGRTPGHDPQSAEADGDDGVLLVSLGTGTSSGGLSLEPEAAAELVHTQPRLQLLLPALRALYGGPGELMRRQLRIALGGRYVRVQAELPPHVDAALDDARPDNLRGLLDTAEQMVQDGEAELHRLAALLVQPHR